MGLAEACADVAFGGEIEDLDALGEPDGDGAASAFLVGVVFTELEGAGVGGGSLEGIVDGSLEYCQDIFRKTIIIEYIRHR